MAIFPAPGPAAQSGVTPGRGLWRDLAIACGCCLLLLTPFLSKPLNIDDPLFVWTAQQITRHPLDFYGFSVSWDSIGGHVQRACDFIQNPPLAAYLLAGAGALLGWSEPALHAVMLLPTLGCVAGVYMLARRFVRHPLAATLLLLVTPAFLVSATTLMCDVPMLCCWVWAVELWLAGSAAVGHRGWLPLAGVAVSAGVLTKYSAVSLVPLLAVQAVLFPSARWITRLVQAGSLLIPLGVLIAYDHYTAMRYGHGLFFGATRFSTQDHGNGACPISVRTLDGLAYVGGCLLPAAAVNWTVLRWRGRLVGCGLAMAAVLAAGMLFVPASDWALTAAHGAGPVAALLPAAWGYYLQCGLLMWAGVLALLPLVAVGRSAGFWPARMRLFLSLWVGGVFVFAAYVNWAMNVRSLLPLAPAVCIAAVAAAERCDRARIRVAVALASLCGVFSIWVTAADTSAARNARAAAEQVRGWLAAQQASPSDRQVFFGGHWGFQYYLQPAGLKPMVSDAWAYHAGDLLIIPRNNFLTKPPDLLGRLRLVGQWHVGTRSALATTCYSSNAGFYHSPGYRLPFVVGSIPSEAIAVWEVVRAPAAGGPSSVPASSR
jgi:4-amino-4-deoxy-L-arabinose transferase-like glycosyltransferase